MTVLVVTASAGVQAEMADASARHHCGVFFASTATDVNGLLRQVVFRFLVIDASTVDPSTILAATATRDVPPAVIVRSPAMFEELLITMAPAG